MDFPGERLRVAVFPEVGRAAAQSDEPCGLLSRHEGGPGNARFRAEVLELGPGGRGRQLVRDGRADADGRRRQRAGVEESVHLRLGRFVHQPELRRTRLAHLPGRPGFRLQLLRWTGQRRRGEAVARERARNHAAAQRRQHESRQRPDPANGLQAPAFPLEPRLVHVRLVQQPVRRHECRVSQADAVGLLRVDARLRRVRHYEHRAQGPQGQRRREQPGEQSQRALRGRFGCRLVDFDRDDEAGAAEDAVGAQCRGEQQPD